MDGSEVGHSDLGNHWMYFAGCDGFKYIFQLRKVGLHIAYLTIAANMSLQECK